MFINSVIHLCIYIHRHTIPLSSVRFTERSFKWIVLRWVLFCLLRQESIFFVIIAQVFTAQKFHISKKNLLFTGADLACQGKTCTHKHILKNKKQPFIQPIYTWKFLEFFDENKNLFSTRFLVKVQEKKIKQKKSENTFLCLRRYIRVYTKYIRSKEPVLKVNCVFSV